MVIKLQTKSKFRLPNSQLLHYTQKRDIFYLLIKDRKILLSRTIKNLNYPLNKKKLIIQMIIL